MITHSELQSVSFTQKAISSSGKPRLTESEIQDWTKSIHDDDDDDVRLLWVKCILTTWNILVSASVSSREIFSWNLSSPVGEDWKLTKQQTQLRKFSNNTTLSRTAQQQYTNNSVEKRIDSNRNQQKNGLKGNSEAETSPLSVVFTFNQNTNSKFSYVMRANERVTYEFRRMHAWFAILTLQYWTYPAICEFSNLSRCLIVCAQRDCVNIYIQTSQYLD